MATSKQVARRKGISQRHARRLAQQKKLKATKPGRDWVFGSTSGGRKKGRKGK